MKDKEVPSIAEMIEADDHRGQRALVQFAAGALIAVGLLFTGYLNFALYSRAFPDTLRILGLIPALLIEGSLAVFLLGSFVWFAAGAQGTLAKLFGWAMFVIVALNCIVEFNALTNAGQNDFLALYAFWGVPVVIPLVIGFWKAVLDSDPAIQVMRQRRKIQQTLHLAKMEALMVALGAEESREALAVYGERSAAAINARLRGDASQPARLPEHILSTPATNGHRPEEAGQPKS